MDMVFDIMQDTIFNLKMGFVIGIIGFIGYIILAWFMDNGYKTIEQASHFRKN
jgi:multisubunit Na+/H+ antiporter MnhF subunit